MHKAACLFMDTWTLRSMSGVIVMKAASIRTFIRSIVSHCTAYITFLMYRHKKSLTVLGLGIAEAKARFYYHVQSTGESAHLNNGVPTSQAKCTVHRRVEKLKYSPSQESHNLTLVSRFSGGSQITMFRSDTHT